MSLVSALGLYFLHPASAVLTVAGSSRTARRHNLIRLNNITILVVGYRVAAFVPAKVLVEFRSLTVRALQSAKIPREKEKEQKTRLLLPIMMLGRRQSGLSMGVQMFACNCLCDC